MNGVTDKNISHYTTNAIKAAQFFISKSRKSSNSFGNETEEDINVIYNYPITFIGKLTSIYEECYLFPC